MASLLNMSCSRVMGGKSLPYDAEIEYLESSGTQWIDTGVIPTSTIHTQVYKSFTELSNNNSGDGVYSGSIRFHDGLFSSKFHFGIGGADSYVNTIAWNSNRHLFELSGSGYAKLDGNVYNISKGLSTYSLSFTLFRRNGLTQFAKEQIVYCKIYQEDILIRDFIPVRVGNVGYMYDKVSGQLFGNAGTGSFILGADKTN